MNSNKSLMLNNLQQMVILATVAQEQNFTRAAERLNVSKSHVSKQIRFLEDTLGCQQVNRNTRSVSLTEIGIQYAEYGQQLLDIAKEGDALVAGYRNEIKGVLRVGVAQLIGNIHVIPAFAAFQKAHPDLEIEVSLFDYRPNLLVEGFDCWLTIREHTYLPEGMVAKRLTDCKFAVVASPEYISKHGSPKTPSDLRNHNCITYQNRERKYVKWDFIRNGVHQSILVHGNFRIDNAPALLDATCSGLGIAYLTTYLLTDEIQSGKLIKLLPEWNANAELPVYAVNPRRKYLAPKVRCFIYFMTDHMSTLLRLDV